MNDPHPLPTDAPEPCPFCGAAPESSSCYFAFECETCGAHGPTADSAGDEAIALWNRRTPSPVGVEPAGYALVPVEPTPEMLSEIWVHKNGSLSEAYRAMLAAAPQPVVREPLTDEAARKQGANHD